MAQMSVKTRFEELLNGLSYSIQISHGFYNKHLLVSLLGTYFIVLIYVGTVLIVDDLFQILCNLISNVYSA